MLETQFFFFQGQQKCYETGGGLFCTTRTECDVFLRWKIPLIHHQTNGKTLILLKTVFFQSRFLPLPAGLKGLMWFMTAAPDMHHHHPTFRVQNGCKLFFLFSFPAKRDSPEHCDTGAQFTFVSFIKWRAQQPPRLHFYSPAKPEHAERRGPGIQPRHPQKLWQNM